MPATFGLDGARGGLGALLDRWLASRWTAIALAAFFVASNIERALEGYFLSEDGLASFVSARMMASDFAATFFFVEARAPIALVFAPLAPLGRGAFALENVVLSAAAIPLLFGVARKLGHARPGLAAIALTFSPLFYAASSAAPRASAVLVGIVGAAYLGLSRDRPIAAGMVLGAVVAASPVSALLGVGLGAALPRDRRSRFAVAACGVALGFAALLAIGHGPLHAARAVASFADGSGPWWSRVGGAAVLGDAVLALGVAPFLIPFARRATVGEHEWLLLVSALGFALAVWLAPAAGFATAAPSDLLPALPFLSLAAARGIEGLSEAPRRAALVAVPLALFVAAELLLFTEGAPSLAFAAATLGVLLTIARVARRPTTLAAVLLVVVVGAFALVSKSGLVASKSGGLNEVVSAFAQRPELRGRTVLTNVPVLAIGVARVAPEAGLDVRLVLPEARRAELEARAAPGDLDRVMRLLDRSPSGRTVEGDALAALLARPGTLVVMARDASRRTLPAETVEVAFTPVLDGEIRIDEVTATQE